MTLSEYAELAGYDPTVSDDGTIWDDGNDGLSEAGVWMPWAVDDTIKDIARGRRAEGDQWCHRWVGTRGYLENGVVMVEEVECDLDGNFDSGDCYPYEENDARFDARMEESHKAQRSYFEYAAETGIDPLGTFIVPLTFDDPVTIVVERNGADETVLATITPDTPEGRAYCGISQNGGVSSAEWGDICGFQKLDPAIPRHEWATTIKRPRPAADTEADIKAAARRALDNLD